MPKDFLIGEWLVQPTLCRVSRADRSVRVRAKVMDLLVFLSEHPGEVLSKDALLNGVWRTEAISESALTRSMTELRQAFGDDPERPCIVETISKRGYRLIAEVREAESVSPISPERRDDAAVVGPGHRMKGGAMSLAYWTAAAAAIPVAVVVATVVARQTVPDVTLGQQTRVTADVGLEIDAALSPDGRFVAYAAGPPGRMRVVVRQGATGRAIPLTADGVGDERRPRWSPDGSLLLFTVEGTLYIGAAPARGTPTTSAVSHSDFIRSAAWSADGEHVFFAAGNSLYRVAAAGGVPVAVRQIDADAYALDVSRDGLYIAYAAGNADFDIGVTQFGNIAPSSIRIAPIAGGSAISVTDDEHLNTSPIWSKDGRSLFFISNREGHLDIYSIGVEGATVKRRPRRLTTGLDAHDLAVSLDSATLAYSLFSRQANVWSLAIPPTGIARTDDAVQLTTGRQTVEEMEISVDRRWLYFDSDLYGNADLFRMPLEGGEPQRLTQSPTDEFINAPSPDGREIAFHAFRSGQRQVFVMPADGGTPAFVVNGLSARWSPDGSRLLVLNRGPIGGNPSLGHSIVTRRRTGEWDSPRQIGDVQCAYAEWWDQGQSLLALCGEALQILSLDGRVVKTLYRPRIGTADPVPTMCRSVDGHIIYCKSYDRARNASFWSTSADGTPPHVLARLEDPLRPASRTEFATDGHKLYVTIDDRQSDVWVATLQNFK